jgi:hypothetical protein
MDLGYKIVFKARLDEEIDEQINSYNLGKISNDSWQIVSHITDEVMESIDFVAGTYSTMLFDLYPYGKPIVVFDTKFKFNSDALQYIARFCSLEDLDRLSDLIYPESADVVMQKSTLLFGSEPIVGILKQIENLSK